MSFVSRHKVFSFLFLPSVFAFPLFVSCGVTAEHSVGSNLFAAVEKVSGSQMGKNRTTYIFNFLLNWRRYFISCHIIRHETVVLHNRDSAPPKCTASTFFFLTCGGRLRIRKQTPALGASSFLLQKKKKKKVRLFIWFYRLSLKVHLHHGRHFKKKGSLIIAIQLLTSAPVTFYWRRRRREERRSHSQCAKNWKATTKIRVFAFENPVVGLQTHSLADVLAAFTSQTWFTAVGCGADETEKGRRAESPFKSQSKIILRSPSELWLPFIIIIFLLPPFLFPNDRYDVISKFHGRH